jgi:hypothetical protein
MVASLSARSPPLAGKLLLQIAAKFQLSLPSSASGPSFGPRCCHSPRHRAVAGDWGRLRTWPTWSTLLLIVAAELPTTVAAEDYEGA